MSAFRDEMASKASRGMEHVGRAAAQRWLRPDGGLHGGRFGGGFGSGGGFGRARARGFGSRAGFGFGGGGRGGGRGSAPPHGFAS